MALIDDFNQAVEDGRFRQKVAIAVSKAVITAISGSPTTAQLNLGRRFVLAPAGEVDRYLLPVAAQLANNSISPLTATDAQIATAVSAVLVLNVTLQVGLETQPA